jgi:acetyl esterase
MGMIFRGFLTVLLAWAAYEVSRGPPVGWRVRLSHYGFRPVTMAPDWLLAPPLARRLADRLFRVAPTGARFERVDLGGSSLASETAGGATPLEVRTFDIEHPFRARVFEPRRLRDEPAEEARLTLFMHGGGHSIGSPYAKNYDTLGRRLAVESRTVVVALEYPLAPQHPFPAAPRACIDAAQRLAGRGGKAAAWLTDALLTWRGTVPGALAVVGDSAGGNLAAVVAAADELRGHISHQVLVYPGFRMTGLGEDWSGAFVLTEDLKSWFRDAYAGRNRTAAEVAVMDRDPLLNPALTEGRLAADRTAPATVILAEWDALGVQGEWYARQLRAAGVGVDLVTVPGTVHNFFAAPAFPGFAQGVSLAARAIRGKK